MQEIVVPDTPVNRALYRALRQGDLIGVQRAFSQGASPDTRLTWPPTSPGEVPPLAPLLGRLTQTTLEPSERPRAAAIFRAFLAHRVDIKAKDEQGMSAIHWAVCVGDLSLVKEVLARGAEVNAPSSYLGTPLIIALSPGLRDKEGPELPLVRFLLEHGANPNVYGTMGHTPLMFTAIANHPKTAALLLKHGANPALVSKPGISTPPRKLTALQWALSAGSAEVARLLRPVSPELTVFEAAQEGDVPRLRKLLDSGTSARSRDDEGTPLLSHAARSGSVEAVTLLLKRGADPNETSRPTEPPFMPQLGSTPLHTAATFGYVAVMRLLLDYKADINALAGRADWPDTPLTRAVQGNEAGAVKLLLERGAKVGDALERYIQNGGRMPLRRRGESPTKRRSQDTVLEQQSQIYALLVARVRDPKALGRALCVALGRDQYALAEDLLRRGADVNAKSPQGEPALFLHILHMALIPLTDMEMKELTPKEQRERRQEDALQLREALHTLDAILARKPNLAATLPGESDWKGGTALAYARYLQLPAVVTRLQKAGLKR